MKEEKNYNTILLEEMRGDIKAIAEGHSILERKMDEMNENLSSRMDRMEADISDLKSNVSDLRSDVSNLKSDVSDLRSEVSDLKSDVSDLRSGQLQVLDYLSRIDEEIQAIRRDLEENYEKKGWDAAWRKQIEEKLERIEEMLKNRDFSGMMGRDK